MKNVLFFNHKIQNCGVYQYGKRVFDIIEKDNEIKYIYKEIDCYEEYCKVLSESNNINAIIYNYHASTMCWLNDSNIQKNIKNIAIPHEHRNEAFFFDILCSIDPNENETTNSYSLPRPIYENIDEIISEPITNSDTYNFINKYTDTSIPIFGSFGFGFFNKGFEKIVALVNEQYDNAIIKFVIPIANFGGNYELNSTIRELCAKENKKNGIILMISHDFFSTSEILQFLKSNTMNIFLYSQQGNVMGISSTIDYALSVKKPIAISDSFMFRNIYSDDICLYKNTIEYCLEKSVGYCSIFLEKYSNQNLVNKFRNILLTNLVV
jgi:hypothetical protein